ncbi:hypothetical protein vBCtySFA70_00042 [Clostridium phage vB_CtyS-FA70]|nr:hypothetical protein vBCtySFA70_00042 [Clostridium phage vB_CtyS-FA70]
MKMEGKRKAQKIRFSKDSLTTYTDVKGKSSLMFFSYGCNLHCYGCHVYNKLNKEVPNNSIGTEEVLKEIGQAEGLAEAVIFSGGEFLIYSAEEIEDFLIEVKKIFSGLIIVNTNGTYPAKMKQISYLVDGFYMDIKAPFWGMRSYNYLETSLFRGIYGVDYSEELVARMSESMLILAHRGKEYDRTRTVDYPILPQLELEDIIVTTENIGIPHDVNDYVESL